MRRYIYILAFLAALPIGRIIAQQGFSFGVGGGPNFFFGSLTEEEKVGYTGQFDVRYDFNSKISSTLSYSFNHLQAARYFPSGLTDKYFQTSASNIDLHIGFDILQISQVVSQDFPLKVIFDLGFGYSFYNEALYYGDGHTGEKIDRPNLDYKVGEHGPGSAAKAHLGGEVVYSFSPKASVFASILGNYYFTSAVDGYEHRIGNPETETLNDFYYSSVIGCRFKIEKIGFANTSRKSASGSYLNNRHGSLFENFRFKQYTGRKSPKETYESNKAKQPGIFPGGRWQGRKKKKAPKSTSVTRFQGKKSKGGIPK